MGRVYKGVIIYPTISDITLVWQYTKIQTMRTITLHLEV